MPLGRRVSKDVAELYEADQALAGVYRDRLAAASRAESDLRDAQARGEADIRALATAFDAALTEAVLAAEASERVAMGTKTYATDAQDAKTRRAAEIARRAAKAKPHVRPWTDEVDRLRTAREAHRLSFRAGGRRAVA
ncbi:plectin [Spirillospora sp. CA-294931]|uniref:plectin n=1 Tax=Spirillospora sp. CA-294931 TaxID=3240042 RepID=UPI003D8CCBAE